MARQCKCPFLTNNLLFFFSLGLLSWQSAPVGAMGYGVYDPRALAMGGSAVAVGNSAQAAYYNPALLATYDSENESRTYMPSLTVQASKAIDAAVSAIDDDLDGKLSRAMSAFNSQSTMANAGRVAESADEMRTVLDKVANRDLTADAFLGFAVSEEGDREGGAFFVGVRTLGVATSNITPTDLDLLDQYIEAMGQISEGVSPILVALLHPALLTANGQFSDPTTRLTSTADIGALVISEWGLALAKEFTLWQQPIQFGFSPKLMRVDAYRDFVSFNNTGLDTLDDHVSKFSQTKTSLTSFNADLGVASLFAEHYRLSFAVKNVVAKNFYTKQVEGPDVKVRLRPHTRMGLAYIRDELSLGLDYDLYESTPIGRESANQELRLGAEYRLDSALALRLGYCRDLVGAAGSPVSAGLGYRGKRFLADVAYTQSSAMKGASLQLGWIF